MSGEETFMFFFMGIFGWFFGGWLGAIGTGGSFSYGWAIGMAILAALMGVNKASEQKIKENKEKLINDALTSFIENNKK